MVPKRTSTWGRADHAKHLIRAANRRPNAWSFARDGSKEGTKGTSLTNDGCQKKKKERKPIGPQKGWWSKESFTKDIQITGGGTRLPST